MRIQWRLNDDGRLTVEWGRRREVLSRGHPNYSRVLAAVRSVGPPHAEAEPAFVAALESLLDIPASLESELRVPGQESDVQVRDGRVLYRGEEVRDVVTDKILRLMADGLPVRPTLAFLEKALQNQSPRSREGLFSFIDRHGLVLTEDGDFIAYKSVESDWTDHHTKTIDNRPGAVVAMDRWKISDDPRSQCHVGLHVGHHRYVRSFMSQQTGRHIIAVLVDPRDVVCVPYEDNFEKVRVCRYKVLHELSVDGLLQATLYSRDGTPYQAPAARGDIVPLLPTTALGDWTVPPQCGDDDDEDEDEEDVDEEDEDEEDEDEEDEDEEDEDEEDEDEEGEEVGWY